MVKEHLTRPVPAIPWRNQRPIRDLYRINTGLYFHHAALREEDILSLNRLETVILQDFAGYRIQFF
jgi:hypothetical protein